VPERVDQLIDGAPTERIHPIRTVDGDDREGVLLDGVLDVGELLGLDHFVLPSDLET
jgi:hypothetical protein